MSKIKFAVIDFRVLKNIEWSPNGLCLLAGANGSGKTTILNALEFLRTCFQFGPISAINDGHAFKRLGAPPECFVQFAVEVDNIAWEIHFPTSSLGPRGQPMERLKRKNRGTIKTFFTPKPPTTRSFIKTNLGPARTPEAAPKSFGTHARNLGCNLSSKL